VHAGMFVAALLAGCHQAAPQAAHAGKVAAGAILHPGILEEADHVLLGR